MADLPEERVVPDLPPFTNVGVDYFGPVDVKRGRSIVKRYGVVFTCMTSTWKWPILLTPTHTLMRYEGSSVLEDKCHT